MAKENKSKATQLIKGIQKALGVDDNTMIELWQNAINKYGSEDGIVEAINQATQGLTQDSSEDEIKAAIASVFTQDSQMFKCGGKLAALFRKFGNGGKCGCGKVVKGQNGWLSTALQNARDAKIGAVGAEQIRDLYNEGRDEEAQKYARKYTNANKDGISLAAMYGLANAAMLQKANAIRNAKEANKFKQVAEYEQSVGDNLVDQLTKAGRFAQRTPKPEFIIKRDFPGMWNQINNRAFIHGKPAQALNEAIKQGLTRTAELMPIKKCGGNIKMHQQGKEIAKSLKCGGKTKKKK